MTPPRFLSSFPRALRRHRRWLAALFAALAVVASVSAASQSSGRPTWVVVAARDLVGGEHIGPQDVVRVALPAQALPDRYLTDPGQAVGRVLTVSLPHNAVVLESAVLSSAVAAPGMAITPVALPGVAEGLIQVGEHLDLFAADDGGVARLVAAQARVVAVPRDAGGGGILGGGTSGGTVVVMVEVPAPAVAQLASAAQQGGLGFALR